MNYKVYVTLGFHINFYHSWRGDTADEAGFGTDIRVMREVLKILDRANAAGLKARAYWDTEVYWTFQEIMPKHAPDILEGMRRRVQAGLDEIVLGPFNNGANHAATEDEFRASVAWALENEWGSGLRQLFGKVAPFYRAQETMFTIGQEAILKEYGMDGLILYYAGVPFNTISSFIPVLPDAQRYNPFWFRSREDQPALIVLPCIAAADLIEQVSLENLMLNLHEQQLRGEIQADVLINLNEDADLETWLPVGLPKMLNWFPNMGGLEEFIRVVNKYPWADFSLPSEYSATHAPTGDVIVRQDLADGGFDGNYSWAEKSASLRAWTLLEQSRTLSLRAEAIIRRGELPARPVLWDGIDSAFFQRLIGLTTTHFGMSTPIINEERQNRAFEILGNALRIARKTEEEVVYAYQQLTKSTQISTIKPSRDSLYDYELFLTPAARNLTPCAARVAASLPVVLAPGIRAVEVVNSAGEVLPASLTDLESLPEGRMSARVQFVADLQPEAGYQVSIFPAQGESCAGNNSLKNQWLSVVFSEENGIEHFTFGETEMGGKGFLDPFITYGDQTYHASAFEFQALAGEVWNGMQRVRLKVSIPMHTSEGDFTSELTYTFSLFEDLPYLFVDVVARYANTPRRQVIHNLTQKLRRLMDLRWVETAPFQLKPNISASADRPLRVWKHNYLGITAYYDLNYGKINPKNSNLDSFNHQVTAGWVAVSNGKFGLLLGENAGQLSSMAVCPMRLREQAGVQSIAVNPFGSYYGKQFDYSHLGGNGNGKVFMQTFSGALQPNGPSFNGETLHFSLMLAPYSGDGPPLQVQADAAAHFYPPGLILQAAPAEFPVESVDALERFVESEKLRAWLLMDPAISPPESFLVNPTQSAVDLVWDAPRDEFVSGYEVEWRYVSEPDWKRVRIGMLTRWHLSELVDGQTAIFRMRSVRDEKISDWTPEQSCAPGAVTDSSVSSMLSAVPLRTMMHVILVSIWSVIRARFQKNG